MGKSGWTAACAAMVVLSGCAGSMETRAEASGREMTRDEAYVARVEQVAKRRGIGVVWVNRPVRGTRHVADASAPPAR